MFFDGLMMMSLHRKRSPSVLDLLVTTDSSVRYVNNNCILTTSGTNPLDLIPDTASQAKVLLTRLNNKTVQLHKTIASIKFNKQCLANNITPKYANIQIKSQTFSAQKTKNFAQKLWVKNEIRTLYIKKDKLNYELYYLHLETANLLTKLDLYPHFLSYLQYIHDKIHQLMTSKYQKMDRKIQKLTDKPTGNTTSNFHKRLVNLTNTTFTDKETALLEKGLKHNLPPHDLQKTIETHILDSETAISSLPIDRQEHIRHKVVDILENTITKQQPSITSNDIKITKQIKSKLKNNDLILTKADKGNVTVIMTKQDYIDKTLDFITKTNCIKLDKDPTDSYHKDIQQVLKRCPNIIDGHHFKYTNMNPRPPILRAQPKIHKKDTPIRPVINYIPAPAYKLAKHLTTILKEILDLPYTYTIRNTNELITKLQNINITEHSRLVSFDIKDLYPSIPVDETIGILKNKLSDLYEDAYINELTDLTQTVLRQNYFRFNNNIYKPQDGLGMGNPTSSLLTEIFLQHYEDIHIQTLMTKHNIKHYSRYVDDILCITEQDSIDSILTDLNKIHPNITYTVEKEEHNTINFLDITITRTNNDLQYGIYRKPTATDTTIHSSSNHPLQHKLAAFRHMIHRLKSIPLTEQNYNKELNTIYTIARNNGYTNKTIDKLLQQYTDKQQIPKDTKPQDEQTTNRRCIFTYTGPETYKLTNLFQKEGLSTTLKTDNLLRNHLNTCIDKTNTYDRSGVYKLTCNCKHTYIGQTGRNLKTRYKEHIRSFRLNTRRSNYANHLYDHQHELTDIKDCMTLLHPQQKGRKLNILENLEIYKLRKFDGRIINKNVLDTTSDTIFKPLDKLVKRKTPTNGHIDNPVNKKQRLEWTQTPPYKRKLQPHQQTDFPIAKRPRNS